MIVWWSSGIDAEHERRVFLVQRVEAGRDLVLVPFGFGMIAAWKTGSGNYDRRIDDREALAAQRVVRVRVLQLHDRTDVARQQPGDFLPVLPVHHEELREAFGLAVGLVDQVEARADRAGADAEERELADVRFGDGLEDEQRREGPPGPASRRLVAVPVRRPGLTPCRSPRVGGRGAVVDEEVQQAGDADVLRRRRAEEREDFPLADAGAQSLADLVHR